jgi:hypothetical protein
LKGGEHRVKCKKCGHRRVALEAEGRKEDNLSEIEASEQIGPIFDDKSGVPPMILFTAWDHTSCSGVALSLLAGHMIFIGFATMTF